MKQYETIQVSSPTEGIVLIRLNRPSKLNAINKQLTADLLDALESYDRDGATGCFVLTGNDKAFSGPECDMLNTENPLKSAAGADISMLSGKGDAPGHIKEVWRRLAAVRTPIVACVTGVAVRSRGLL